MTDTEKTEEREPTIAEVMAIAQAAKEAAEKATAGNESRAAASAASDKADSLGLSGIDTDALTKILDQVSAKTAESTVEALAKRFEIDGGDVNPTSLSDTATEGETGDGSGSTSSASETRSKPDEHPNVGRTFAQKYLGL